MIAAGILILALIIFLAIATRPREDYVYLQARANRPQLYDWAEDQDDL